ncbi:MAG: hypothetical protein IKP00_13120 [Victivallales bacterium]|nr:hypothetical protein [Victivallales bacterium]
MMKTNWLCLWLGVMVALPLCALDRDFHAIGDGVDAPQRLDVYRRAQGYTILVTIDGRAATVSAANDGKPVFSLNSEGIVTLPDGRRLAGQTVVQGKEFWGYFIPDTVPGIGENDLLDLTVAYEGSQAILPDAVGSPLRVSGRKGREYNWNDEETTILEQISNTRLDFTDFAYDVADATVADLISGAAEVQGETLHLKAVLRKPADCTLRVLLDTLPDVGYATDGADFLLDNAMLAQFAGSQPKEWKWTDVMKVPFTREGAVCTWEVPLKAIRPTEAGRIRIRFQTRTSKGNDEMPSFGKILPILRPGNLAADPATKVIVSGCTPMYKAYPLTDGQTSRRIHWCFESWAAGSGDPLKFAEFRFPTVLQVRQMIVWWEDMPKAAEVQILLPDGRWNTVFSRQGSSGAESADWVQAETGAAIVDAAQEKLKKAEKNTFQFPVGTTTNAVRITDPKSLWIREIEVY